MHFVTYFVDYEIGPQKIPFGILLLCTGGDPPVTDSTYAGLDIGYVPAGPHAFFRSSGQFGPQFNLCWPAGPVAFNRGFFSFSFFFRLTML